ncbi:MAG: hypothetical protein EGQ02_24065 [Enterobacter cloacae]|nr:hypothetical protein [Enterobacter cloacae]
MPALFMIIMLIKNILKVNLFKQHRNSLASVCALRSRGLTDSLPGVIPAGNTTFWRRPLPFWITLFIPGYSLTKKRCYHSPRKYLSTLPEALMLENVII